jgi:hypothetical protein
MSSTLASLDRNNILLKLVERNVQKFGAHPQTCLRRYQIMAKILLRCLQIYQVCTLLVEHQYFILEGRSTDNIVFKSSFLPHINDAEVTHLWLRLLQEPSLQIRFLVLISYLQATRSLVILATEVNSSFYIYLFISFVI